MSNKMAALAKQFKREPAEPEPSLLPTPAPVAVSNDSHGAPRKTKKAVSQSEKIHVGAYLSPAFGRSLRMVQAHTGMKMQDALAEALNELFHKYNVPKVDQG